MSNTSLTYNHISQFIINENGSSNEEFIPVPVLAKQLFTYKVSDYILTYLAVPIAIWGFIGNLLSLR